MASEDSAMRRARFDRVAERRTRRLLVHLRALGRCANPDRYAWTQKDVRQIFQAIEVAWVGTRRSFHPRGDQAAFKLNHQGEGDGV